MTRTDPAPESYIVDYQNVASTQLESSPVAAALAGLRANDARYFANKYQVAWTSYLPAAQPDTVAWVENILRTERGIEFAAPVLAVAEYRDDSLFWPNLYYQNGLGVNVAYQTAPGGKRAVGFKLSEGMAVPLELATFKFARQRSKLAGEIRGSFFVVKGDYPLPA